jgi:hypothetical protein
VTESISLGMTSNVLFLAAFEFRFDRFAHELTSVRSLRSQGLLRQNGCEPRDDHSGVHEEWRPSPSSRHRRSRNKARRSSTSSFGSIHSCKMTCCGSMNRCMIGSVFNTTQPLGTPSDATQSRSEFSAQTRTGRSGTSSFPVQASLRMTALITR